MNFEKCVLYRVAFAAPDEVRSLLAFCLVKFAVHEEKKTLLIKAPDPFVAYKINSSMAKEMGIKVNNLGIDRYSIDNSRGSLSLYEFDGSSFVFSGYSSLQKLKL
ncbi:MAG: hypothetical protein ACFBSE_21410 [Prochloraceae cyanobacterium]